MIRSRNIRALLVVRRRSPVGGAKQRVPLSTFNAYKDVWSRERSRDLQSIYPSSADVAAKHWQIRTPKSCLFSSASSSSDDPESNLNQSKQLEFLSSVKDSLFQDIFPQILSAPEMVHDDGKDNNNNCMVLLVGVSGGCDSMGLLHALLDLSQSILTSKEMEGQLMVRQFTEQNIVYQALVHVVHFDHCQRGEASERDCQFVQDVCQQENLPCHVYRWNDSISSSNDVDTSTDESSSSFSQERARNWRQSTMTKLLQQLTTDATKSKWNDVKKGAIMTAHHADDSQETLLLKLLRGVHITNLSGMDQIQQNMQQDVSTNAALFARPLLRVTKSEIQQYLLSRGYSWREDASNQSNKYLRNRVRNELIPLLQDMVGGDETLRKRLENLEEQSGEIRADLSPRVKAFLEQHTDNNRIGQFLLPKSLIESGEMDLVARQALYHWASTATKYQFSYDLLKRVCTQIAEYPDRRVWTIEIGEGWLITRKGDALQIEFRSGDDNHRNVPESYAAKRIPWTKVAQSCQADTDKTTGEVLVVQSMGRFELEKDSEAHGFYESTAGQDLNGWRFTPPWRKGRSPTKLGNFLRGQKVPLHQRDSTPIIYFTGNSQESSLVAVHVQEEWIIDASWSLREEAARNSSDSIVLHIGAPGYKRED